jgi:uncharacterized protein involved in outer membrane biogenesis
MKAIKIIFALAGLLLVAAILWSSYLLLSVDENKGLLEERFSAGLGREVRIEQGVKTRWSLMPSIELEGLWIGNPDWAKGEYFVRADRAFVRIDILALLRKQLVVKELTLQGADALLETAEDGRTNWSFGEDGAGIDVSLDEITVKDSRLSHRSPDGEVLQAVIPEIRFEGVASEELALKARFSYRDVPITAALNSRPQAVSRAGERPFQGEIEMPGTTLKVHGELKGLLELVNLEVELQSDRLDLHKSVLGRWSAVPLEGSLQQLSGHFKTAGDSQETLLGNLSGELKVGSAALKIPARKGGKATNLMLHGLNLTTAIKQAVQLKTGLVYEKQTYQVEVSGGMLADLFSETKSWNALKFKIGGQVDKKPLQITGDVGPLSAVHGGGSVKAKLSLLYNEMKVRLDGTFANLNEVKGSRFALDASGPSLSRLNPLLGLGMPDTPPFALVARVEGSERQLQFKKLKVTSGKSDISGELSIPLVQGERIEGQLEARRLDLELFFAQSDRPSEGAPLMDRELAPDVLQGLDGALQLKIARLGLVALELEQVKLDAALDKGHLKLALVAENEDLTADVDLRPVGGDWQFALHHKGKLDLGQLIDREKLADERSQAPLDVEMRLKGTGKTLTGMLESADGNFTMVVGEGRLSETISRHLPMGSVLFTLLGALDPKHQREKQAKLECAVIQLDVAKGIATSSKGLALRTDQINVLGGGALKLPTREIDLQFKTAQRKGLGLNILGLADRLIRLSGTLDDPKVVLDPTGAAAFGAAAWATAGLSLVADSIWTRITAFSNPCDHVLKSVKK